MNFSNFLLWEVYPSMVIGGEYFFITYDSAGREKRIFNNLSKLQI